MATRSTIAIEFADGSVSQVYCHWDGYLDNNGEMLNKHYMDPFKVRDLIDLGDFSSLCETVEQTKETAYHHARGEDFVVRRYTDMIDYFEECQQEEYDYILRRIDGSPVWFVRCYATENRWVTLGEARMCEAKMNEVGAH
jgi:hypothetical protein